MRGEGGGVGWLNKHRASWNERVGLTRMKKCRKYFEEFMEWFASWFGEPYIKRQIYQSSKILNKLHRKKFYLEIGSITILHRSFANK